ncbi:CCA tRNA nucleotidyltransferase [Acetobacter oeni]|uniref:CCA tRNA nucleotidyltransferase n=2 Tax=Acetobacter oeni TaxID=304077 RepID=UPI0015695C33|nr:CCA tRNA nucleotidyltransferase [Acetobacter oeni]MBB3881494.1 poly(A) polymerase [Acetobacter oeni]GBR10828.1 polynucleotide adenylyltransferase [Acetobacter oeni LMG 21952]
MITERRLPLDTLRAWQSLQKIWSVLPDSRLVGGAVRDLLLEKDVADFDFGTPEPPGQVTDRLTATGIKTIPTGLSHGTVTAVIDGAGFEITTLRRDERTDGRHAEVAWTQDWREDAARRDFTINAMSCDRDGRVYDYFGGLADLHAARVRFVGNARERIGEDALRILRFFRFQGRFGDMPPDRHILSALSESAVLVQTLSVERVWSELRRILTGPHAPEMLALMSETGVMNPCLPELGSHRNAAIGLLASLIACGAPPDARLRLAALLKGAASSPDLIRQCVKRLRLSRADACEVVSLCGEPAPTPQLATDEAGVARLLADTPRTVLTGRAWLAQAEAAQRNAHESENPDWNTLRHHLTTDPVPVFPLAGRDLVALGIPAGPRVGEVLAGIRQHWREAGCRDGKEACLASARSLISQIK